MTRLYKPDVPMFPWLHEALWCCAIGLWFWGEVKRQGVAEALGSLAVYGIMVWLISLLVRRFTLAAYDDGDAVVLKRGRHSERIPFHQISQVDYVTVDGGIQKVRLHLSQPSHFGNPVTFVIARDSAPERHSAIADDLHRRAREARETSSR